ncbi:hypothetical protein V5T82_01335 [Magnetovibrio sp. PR-2]|uniref:hypothetical protein n=1 Tax=Magnetovibrio sp. PR-2 TaxID=3120356 RepID=UPI002FCE556D
MLKSLFPIALATALLLSSPVMAADALFSTAIEDLPLMEGMVEHADAVQFSTSAGRIAEVIVDAPYSKDAVLAFYKDTLPQLGWTALDLTEFKREGEVLKLTIETQGSSVAVRFVLAPHE